MVDIRLTLAKAVREGVLGAADGDPATSDAVFIDTLQFAPGSRIAGGGAEVSVAGSNYRGAQGLDPALIAEIELRVAVELAKLETMAPQR